MYGELKRIFAASEPDSVPSAAVSDWTHRHSGSGSALRGEFEHRQLVSPRRRRDRSFATDAVAGAGLDETLAMVDRHEPRRSD